MMRCFYTQSHIRQSLIITSHYHLSTIHEWGCILQQEQVAAEFASKGRISDCVLGTSRILGHWRADYTQICPNQAPCGSCPTMPNRHVPPLLKCCCSPMASHFPNFPPQVPARPAVARKSRIPEHSLQRHASSGRSRAGKHIAHFQQPFTTRSGCDGQLTSTLADRARRRRGSGSKKERFAETRAAKEP